MRSRTVIPLVALVAAAVLALAVWGLRWERRRLLDDFGQAQGHVAGQLAIDLGRELDELDDDARLIATLVGRARDRAAIDADDERRFMLSAFDALATVVRHYRALTLVRDGAVALAAPDPSERREVSDLFAAWSTGAAGRISGAGQSVLEGPREGPDGRQFFVYARGTAPGEVVVLVSEARHLLQPVLRARGVAVRYFLLDPTRSVWIGCAQPATCRALTADEWRSVPELAALVDQVDRPAGHAWRADGVARAVGVDSRPAALAWSSLERGGRRWTVGVVASAQAIEARERSLLAWLVGTSAALAVALGTVAAWMVVHHRRSAELRARLQHAEELAQLRERTERLLENVSVGLVGVSADGRVVLTNRFFADRAGVVAAGSSFAEALAEGEPYAAAALRDALAQALRTGRPRFLTGDDVRILASRPGHFDLRIIPLAKRADEVAALVLVEDLSELKSLETQLVRAEKLVTVGVLTAGLAHEIGTPLGIIRGRAEVLLAKVTDRGLAQDLESIIRQIDQIGSVIRQVLDFARAQPVELRPVAPRRAIESAVALLEWRLRQKKLSVRIEGPSELPAVAADPDQLQQVLVNLLLNAADACDRGGTIVVRLSAEGATLRIEVQDDGCGIAAEDLNAVFDPFFTTKKRGEGTGLGLPVAASIVRNHHGEISLVSEKGAGTTVTLSWPAALPREARAHG